jgi:alkylation response protein AidB-like acyl-CoA dehydrogenase
MSFLAYPQTEQQKNLVSMASELADTFAARAVDYDWAGRFPLENYEDLRKSGYLTLAVPRDFGGYGASLLDVVIAQTRLAQGCASTALAVSMHLVNSNRLAQVKQPNETLTKIFRSVVEDGAMINTAASERATGSPSRGGRPTTTAQRQPDGSWIINGRKAYTTGSLALKYFIVSCGIEDTSGLESLKADRGNFLITNDTPGVGIEETWNSLGMRASGSNDVILDNVHVDAEAFMDVSLPLTPADLKPTTGWVLATTAVYFGVAQAARNAAITFAQHRRPNSLDKPISSLPHIQEKAAKMELALLQSKALLFDVAEQFSNAPESVSTSTIGAAKYMVTNHAVEVVDQAMRLVGAASLAVSSNNPLQRYYRDVRAGLHNPPMEDAVIAQLGRDALEEQQ